MSSWLWTIVVYACIGLLLAEGCNWMVRRGERFKMPSSTKPLSGASYAMMVILWPAAVIISLIPKGSGPDGPTGTT